MNISTSNVGTERGSVAAFIPPITMFRYSKAAKQARPTVRGGMFMARILAAAGCVGILEANQHDRSLFWPFRSPRRPSRGAVPRISRDHLAPSSQLAPLLRAMTGSLLDGEDLVQEALFAPPIGSSTRSTTAAPFRPGCFASHITGASTSCATEEPAR